MNRTLQLRSWLALGASTAALLAGAPAFAQATGGAAATPPTTAVGEIVVTAQRRSEALQSVPVAVSAFSPDTLKAQRLDGGQNLELSVPNVNYSRSNFGGYNLQIRGIGTKVITTGAESGVSINENTLPLGANHLSDTDFYDVERVEVLRGPQGTLYGRNATGGAVNVITAKPTDLFSASLTGEYGNFDSKKVTGFVNLPFGDMFSVRVAGFWLNRDGLGTNSITGDKVDGRNLGSGRVTLSFKPNDRFHATLMYEHFGEDDSRNRVGKQLCIKDPGLTSVGGVATDAFIQGATSQGCQAGSLYSNAAYGTVNSNADLAGIYQQQTGQINAGQDIYGDHPLQNHNLHDIESVVDPRYKSDEDLVALNMSYEITDNLTVESITGYNRNYYFETEDYNRIVPGALGINNATPQANCYFCLPVAFTQPFWDAIYGGVTPNGYISDPQLGTSNKLRVFDQADGLSKEFTEEIRLVSSFKGPLNFTFGGIYGDNKATTDYYVFFNPLTSLAQYLNAIHPIVPSVGPYYIDPSNPPTVGGHNYYNSHATTHLSSYALFGEATYKFTDDLKLTLGLRQTEDDKYQDAYPIELFVPGPGGFPNGYALEKHTFRATTGRVNLEWTPHLSFTNQTTIYGSYARGYKGGGFNTPCQNVNLSSSAGGCGYPATFQSEYIDAFEIGTKNTALGGSLVLNLTGFYYDYAGYQVSTIVKKSSVNANIDAKIYGAEIESVWRPTHELTFNGNIGYLHTEITRGSLLDQSNLTQGDPNLTLIKASDGSNCVVNTAVLAAILPTIQPLPVGYQEAYAYGICSGGGASPLYTYGSNVATNSVNGVAVGQGIPVNLKGKRLPNSPDFTVSVGAQYVWNFEDWKTTLRGDYYWQDSSYARIFNATQDRLRSWDNANATLTFDRANWGLNVQLFIKNIFDKMPITDAYLTDASSGLFYNTFTLEPRTYGISITKKFG